MKNVYIIIEERYENRDKNIPWNRVIKDCYSSKQKAIDELQNLSDFYKKNQDFTNVEITINENKDGIFAAWLRWTDETGRNFIRYIERKTLW